MWLIKYKGLFSGWPFLCSSHKWLLKLRRCNSVMYEGTMGAATVHCKHLFIVKSRKMNPPAFCELREETTGSPTVPESGRPSCLIILPSLSVLSLLNHISLQLTECHASEGGLISPASQTFYLSILLLSKGHIFTFTPAQSTCGIA